MVVVDVQTSPTLRLVIHQFHPTPLCTLPAQRNRRGTSVPWPMPRRKELQVSSGWLASSSRKTWMALRCSAASSRRCLAASFCT